MSAGPAGDLPAPPLSRSGMSTPVKVLIVALVVLLVAAVGFGSLLAFSVGTVASDHVATTSLLDKVRTDNNGISEQLKKNPDFSTFVSGSTPDFAGFQKQLHATSAQFSESSSTIATDLRRLRSEDARVKGREGSLQAIFGKNQYEADRKRVESAIDAFDAAGTLLGLLQRQFAYYDKLLGALDAFQAMTAKVDSGNISGALNLYPPLETAITASVTASSDQSVSPQHKALTKALNATVADFKAVLQAAQANDAAAGEAALAKLQADGADLGKFDDAAFKAWEAALVHPYQVRYEKGLTAAGFKVVV